MPQGRLLQSSCERLTLQQACKSPSTAAQLTVQCGQPLLPLPLVVGLKPGIGKGPQHGYWLLDLGVVARGGRERRSSDWHTMNASTSDMRRRHAWEELTVFSAPRHARSAFQSP